MTHPPGPPYPEPAQPGPAAPDRPATAAPASPGAGTPPPYPVAPPPPAPTMPPAPPYPTAPPGAGHPAAPPHPGVPAPAAPYPATGLPHPMPAQPPHPAPFMPQPVTAPDDLDYRHQGTRRHVAAHQRGADATAVGQLATQIPAFLVSLAVVAAFSFLAFGPVLGPLLLITWLASGALVFHRPTELLFAQRVLKLRAPLAEERARLEPIWHEVTARAGIEADTYELMIQNSTELNASAAAGHVVGVTTYALNHIPSSNLAAVLAHELGHHTGGHAWAGLLGYWYSLPGRIAWAVARTLARAALTVSRVFTPLATLGLYLGLGMFLVLGFMMASYLTVPLMLAPYLLAYAGRQGELRADQAAAALGFAPQLTEVLHHLQAQEDAAKAYAAAQGRRLREPAGLAKLLSSHPDNYTRMRALEPHLAPAR